MTDSSPSTSTSKGFLIKFEQLQRLLGLRVVSTAGRLDLKFELGLVAIGGGRSGIAIGSEISTEVRNVFVDNVRIENALRGIRLKS